MYVHFRRPKIMFFRCLTSQKRFLKQNQVHQMAPYYTKSQRVPGTQDDIVNAFQSVLNIVLSMLMSTNCLYESLGWAGQFVESTLKKLGFVGALRKMAKNTSSSAFRKIDVDQYNEDNFKEDEVDMAGSIGPDENEVTKLLNSGKNIEALKLVLENAPLTSKNQVVKDNALNLTLRVILSIKSLQMDSALDSLSNIDLLDVLMKYIYRGFEIPSEGSSGHLLQWHEKVFSRGGVGCITRVLTDTHRA